MTKRGGSLQQLFCILICELKSRKYVQSSIPRRYFFIPVYYLVNIEQLKYHLGKWSVSMIERSFCMFMYSVLNTLYLFSDIVLFIILPCIVDVQLLVNISLIDFYLHICIRTYVRTCLEVPMVFCFCFVPGNFAYHHWHHIGNIWMYVHTYITEI